MPPTPGLAILVHVLLGRWRAAPRSRAAAEPIARRANREDEVSGRLWQGRYRCQALLDERAILAALAYVDLNPIRAGIADGLEHSHHTSVRQRIAAVTEQPARIDQPLQPVAGLPLLSMPCTLGDYLQLVEWTGRQQRGDKRGAIARDMPNALRHLGLPPERWQLAVRGIGSGWWRAVGGASDLLQLARDLGQCWLKGTGFARRAGLA